MLQGGGLRRLHLRHPFQLVGDALQGLDHLLGDALPLVALFGFGGGGAGARLVGGLAHLQVEGLQRHEAVAEPVEILPGGEGAAQALHQCQEQHGHS